jgi:hypothetical protein
MVYINNIRLKRKICGNKNIRARQICRLLVQTGSLETEGIEVIRPGC